MGFLTGYQTMADRSERVVSLEVSKMKRGSTMQYDKGQAYQFLVLFTEELPV